MVPFERALAIRSETGAVRRVSHRFVEGHLLKNRDMVLYTQIFLLRLITSSICCLVLYVNQNLF